MRTLRTVYYWQSVTGRWNGENVRIQMRLFHKRVMYCNCRQVKIIIFIQHAPVVPSVAIHLETERKCIYR